MHTHDVDLSTGSGYGKGYDYTPPWAERARAGLAARLKRVAQRVLRGGLGAIGALDALAHAWQRRPQLAPATFHPRRILVIRTDFLGDMVLTLPAIDALHRAYPAAAIDVVTLPGNAGILAGYPGIARVITANPAEWLGALASAERRHRINATLRELRAARYDLALSVCGDWASVVARLSGARRRVGYAAEAYDGWLTDALPGGRSRERRHEIEFVRDLAARAGGVIAPSGSREHRPRLPVSPDARDRVARLLAAHGVTPGQRIVALHAGSGNGRAKRWPLPYWARLADLLGDEGVAIVLVGAPGDKDLARGVVRRMHQPARAIDLTGATALPDLVALLAACAVVVTGDSGPLHIAEAVDARVVALHGPTDPAQSGPSAPGTIVLRRDLWCSPCYDPKATAECRFYNPICMKGIGPAEALAAVRAQLAMDAALAAVL